MDPRITVAFMTDTTLSTFGLDARVHITLPFDLGDGNVLPAGTVGTVQDYLDTSYPEIPTAIVVVLDALPGRPFAFDPRLLALHSEFQETAEPVADPVSKDENSVLDHLLFHLGQAYKSAVQAYEAVTPEYRPVFAGYLEALAEVQDLVEHVR